MLSGSASRGRAELALVAMVLAWGTTFVVVKRALDDASPLLFVAVRFTLASVALAWIFRRDLPHLRQGLRGGVVAGVFLFGGYAFQTAALRLTSAAKTAFLTGLFVVLVPIFAAWIDRVWPSRMEWLGAAVSFIGMGLMTIDAQTLSMGRGDWLGLLCAVCFSLHAVFLNHYTQRSGFAGINLIQIAATAILAWCGAGLLESPYFRPTPQLWTALAITSMVATALAFTIMAWAQQHTTATRTALICSLEPVVAGVTSFAVLGESLAPRALAGAALILTGVVVVEMKPGWTRRNPMQ